MSERHEYANPLILRWREDSDPEIHYGLTKLERTVIAVVESGVCGHPREYARPDGGKTPEQQYSFRVLRAANAVWDALEKEDGS